MYLGGEGLSKIIFFGSDRMLTHMNGRLLSRNGYDVKCTAGIDEVLQTVRSQKIDAVVADMEVDTHQIVSFCRRVKETEGTTKLLLISESWEDEIPVLNAGADDWIKKPYQMRVLYARLNVLLRR